MRRHPLVHILGTSFAARAAKFAYLALLLAWVMPVAAGASTVAAYGTPSSQNGHDQQLIYTAAPGEVNDLRISTRNNGTYQDSQDVIDDGVTAITPGENCEATSNPRHVICSVGQQSSGMTMTVRLGDGNDQARITPLLRMDIYGDAGNDTISTDGWIDFLYGGDGDDTLITTDDYADRLYGEGGDDTMKTSQPLDRTDPDGGPGNDTFDFSNRSGNVTATANATETDTVNGYPGIENFVGGTGDDTLTGDDGSNSLAGGLGNDTLSGLGGDDLLEPGPGPTTVATFTLADNDTVDGGAGSGDLATYKTRSAALSISNDGVADDGQSGESDNIAANVENLHGGTGDDSLTGNGVANVLNGWTGTDRIEGNGGVDTASYDRRSADMVVTLDGAANDGAVGENDQIIGDVENAWGGRGDDRITGSNPISGRLTLPGRNELRGGMGDDTLNGLGDDDTLFGDGIGELLLDTDNDTLRGGEGNDRLIGDDWKGIAGLLGDDDIGGGGGTDLLDYSTRVNALTIDIPAPPPFVAFPPPPAANDGEANETDSVWGDVENVTGGAGADTITGNTYANVLDGGSGGRDVLSGAGNDDRLIGGDDTGFVDGDTLNGGDGTDSLIGGGSRDLLDGGPGGDMLAGGNGNDTLGGGSGADALSGDAGDDLLNGGDDADILNAGGAAAGSGDELNGDGGADGLSVGGSSGVTLNGGEGDDSLNSVGGSSTMTGGGGNDTLTTGTGIDTVGGGAGSDRVTYAGRTGAVAVTIGNGIADDGQPSTFVLDDNVLADVENVTGSPAGDTLTGNDAVNALDGTGGNDTLVGNEGADQLTGGDGDDHLKSHDSSADQDDCGPGAADKITADGLDTVSGCERSAPLNAVAPSISGTVVDGQLLTATPGTWLGEAVIAYTFRWRSCGSDGATCVNISGAGTQTYALTPAEVGRRIRVRVTATNGVDSIAVDSGPTDAVAPAPPANTAQPTITGVTRDGETLTAGNGTWSGTPPIAFTYQWRRCGGDGTGCTDIVGETGVSYDLTAGDVGKRLRVRLTAINATGPGSAAASESAPSDVVAPSPPVSLTMPTISGTPHRGETLTANAATWSGTPPISFTYQWRRCDADTGVCANIAGATGQNYVLVTADVARRLRVSVTATNAAGASTALSAATNVVIDTGGAPEPAPRPPIAALLASHDLTITSIKILPKTGGAIITVELPDPGTVELLATATTPRASTRPRASKTFNVSRIQVTAVAGTVRLTLVPSRTAKAILKLKRKLRVSAQIAFRPTAGAPSAQTKMLTLRLKKRR